MKRLLFSLLFTLIFGLAAWSQAAKPKIMVYPSDKYCLDRGYATTIMKDGVPTQVPDIQKAVSLDGDLRTAIRAIGHFMQENNFPIEDLEQKLKSMNDDDIISSAISGKQGGGATEESPLDVLTRTAKPDILISLDISVQRQGPRMTVNFALDAFDAYSNKRIDGLQNPQGSMGTNLDLLIQEGVLATKDAFLSSLQRHFDDMFANGREIVVQIQKMDAWDGDFQDEFEYNGDEYELADIIRSWFNKNTVQKRYTVSFSGSSRLIYDQVRIPIYTTDIDGDQQANDADQFGNQLAKYLKKVTGFNTGRKPIGLGKVIVTVGDKPQ